MDYLNEQPLKLVFIVERPLPKSQKKSEQRQDLFQKRLGVTEPCHLQLSLTAKIVDLLQNARDNVFAEIVSADMSVYFAEKLTVEQFAPDMLLFPANALAPPYVCNVCKLRRGCSCDRAYYVAIQAQAVAMRRYSETTNHVSFLFAQLILLYQRKRCTISALAMHHGARAVCTFSVAYARKHNVLTTDLICKHF